MADKGCRSSMLVNFDVASRTDERRAGIQSKSVKATVDRAEAGHAPPDQNRVNLLLDENGAY